MNSREEFLITGIVFEGIKKAIHEWNNLVNVQNTTL
jgi:hypothetical protein